MKFKQKQIQKKKLINEKGSKNAISKVASTQKHVTSHDWKKVDSNETDLDYFF